MNILNFLLKRKLSIHYISILIIIVGIFTVLKMQREARPNVNFNRAYVSVAYPGASPSDIEELVIDPVIYKCHNLVTKYSISPLQISNYLDKDWVMSKLIEERPNNLSVLGFESDG